MIYKIPLTKLNSDTEEELNRIEKTIDTLNAKRDEGLSKELLDNLKRQLLIKQVYHSNAIEGNKLSLRETELILNGMVINERPLKDEIEAKSLARATDYLYSLIDGREPLTKRTLLELHSLIMQDIPGIEAGKFRHHDVKIKNSEHTPPSFLELDNQIDELFQWMNRNSHKHPPLIMGSIFLQGGHHSAPISTKTYFLPDICWLYSSMVICLMSATPSNGLSIRFHEEKPPCISLISVKPFLANQAAAALLLPPEAQYTKMGCCLSNAAIRSVNSGSLFQFACMAFFKWPFRYSPAVRTSNN